MNNNIYLFAKKIISFPRSLSGRGTLNTLKEIKKILPKIKIKKFQTGEKVFDWKIPNEWNVKDAYLITPEGKKICDYKKNSLHLIGYSVPIDKKISKKELEKNLFSIPNLPNAIPYITSYYKRTWGFCISHKERKKLKKGLYRAVIKSKLTKGHLIYGEIIIKGKTKKEILLSTYICHPEMANNETSGIAVLTYLTKWIKSKKRNFTYRILFLPETIGSIAYLNKNNKILKKNVVAGYVITCVGDNNKFSYIPSRQGNTLSDYVAKKKLNLLDKKFKSYSWLDRGSDERQYCSPGVDLPICSITKSKYGSYKEYHTSLDKLGNIVTSNGLNESYTFYKSCINFIEREFSKNFLFPIIKTFCEPFLSRLNLYPTTSTINTKNKVQDLLNVISYCDGKNSISQITDLCQIKRYQVIKILKVLKKNKLIK